MRDHGTALRTAFYNALNGALTLRSTAVPVVDGKLEELPAEGVFVVFGNQSEDNRSNKGKFVYNVTLDMAIVNKRKSTGSKVDVESVSDQILDIIVPTAKGAHGLTIAAPFSITDVRYNSGAAEALVSEASGQFVQVKRLQFTNRITQ